MTAPQPEAARLSDAECDRVLSFLQAREWFGLDRDDVRTLADAFRAPDQQTAPQPEAVICDACDRVRHQWQRECADTDSLLQTLGLCPSEYRSDGGSLLLGRISHKLASIAAAKPEAK